MMHQSPENESSANEKQFDWRGWVPRERANLCFLIDAGRVLLIHKKRGLGAGKINGPGGKVEPGESALQSAIRETQEEIGVTPAQLEERGTLHFQFADGYSLECTLFVALQWAGEPVESAEAIPFWVAFEEVPYAQMWADDQYWLPRVLLGESVRGRFYFEGDRMLSKELQFGGDAT